MIPYPQYDNDFRGGDDSLPELVFFEYFDRPLNIGSFLSTTAAFALIAGLQINTGSITAVTVAYADIFGQSIYIAPPAERLSIVKNTMRYASPINEIRYGDPKTSIRFSTVTK